MLMAIVIIIGCKSEDVYYGAWADTFCEFRLTSNHEFKIIYTGHLGDGQFKGIYEIVDDTIFLTFFNNEPRNIFSNSLLMIGDSCLLDLQTGYDYCTNRTFDWTSRKIEFDQASKNSNKEVTTREKLYNIILDAPDSIYQFVVNNLSSNDISKLCREGDKMFEINLSLLNYKVDKCYVNKWTFKDDSLLSFKKSNELLSNIFINNDLIYTEITDSPNSEINFRLESLKLCKIK